MRSILIIEDDILIAELERDYLEASNYKADITTNGKEGLEKALTNKYDLILLDLMLPSKNGFEICKEIRKVSNVPIIMVTAKKEDIDIIRGFGLGSDDYVIKPFSPAQLIARVRAHIDRHEKLTNNFLRKREIIEIYDLKIDTSSHRVFIRNKEIILANKEFELLCFLASNPNIVFSKENLFDKIWGEDIVGDLNTVAVHINRLREKIEDDSSSPIYIETVWGAGYRFTMG